MSKVTVILMVAGLMAATATLIYAIVMNDMQKSRTENKKDETDE